MAKKRKQVTTIFNQLQLVEQMLDSGEIPAVLQDSHYRLLHMVLRYFYHDLNLRGNDLLVEMVSFIHNFDIDFFGGLDEILSEESLSKLTPLHRDDKKIKFYRSEIDAINTSELSIGAKRLLFAILWFKKTKLAINESADYLFDNSLNIYNNLDSALTTAGKARYELLSQLAENGFISIEMSLDARVQIKELKEDNDNEVVFETSEVTNSKEAFEMLIGALRRRNFIVINIAEYFENGSYVVINSLAQAKEYAPTDKIKQICNNERFQHKGFTFIEIEDGRLLLVDYKDLRDKLVHTHMTLVRVDFIKLKKKGFKLHFSIDGNEILLSSNDSTQII